MDRYRQELLLDDRDVKITLLQRAPGAEPLRVGPVSLEGGSTVVWFTFPGRSWEVAGLYDPLGELIGHYTNLVRPPELEDGRWRIVDRFVDVWSPADGEPRLLDLDELAEARTRGAISEGEAAEAEATARDLLDRTRRGDWPPRVVEEWPLDAIEALRLRRDEPGTYYANLVSTRIIAWGIYYLGVAAITSVGFAGLTDAFGGGAAARKAWVLTLGAEALGLLPLALAGKLPAARRVRMREVLNETTLFLAAAVSAVAILAVHDSSLWRSLLGSVYGALGLFLAIFAFCRAVYDRTWPTLAIAGLVVCAVAFLILV